jgi:ribonuclease-3
MGRKRMRRAPEDRSESSGDAAHTVQRVEQPVQVLEQRLGVHFQQPEVLLEALTHRSYIYETPAAAGERYNERLEFLGDAILAFLSAEYLFRSYPALNEGELTDARAALVKTTTLAGFARSLELGKFLRLGKGEARSGGRERDPLLAAAFEALLGALYLDSGVEEVRRFLVPLLEDEARRVISERRLKDAKSLLQELAQAQVGLTPTYRVVTEEGPSHQRLFTVEVLLGEQVAGRGQGRNKQLAEQEAARLALEASGWL